jgi:hypothetical protein
LIPIKVPEAFAFASVDDPIWIKAVEEVWDGAPVRVMIWAPLLVIWRYPDNIRFVEVVAPSVVCPPDTVNAPAVMRFNTVTFVVETFSEFTFVPEAVVKLLI